MFGVVSVRPVRCWTMPRPRRPHSLCVTLALAWLPGSALVLPAALGSACLMVTSVGQAAVAPPSAPPETGPPPPSGSKRPSSPPAPPTTVRARTPPASPSQTTPPAATGGGGDADDKPPAEPQDLSGTWGYSRRSPRTPKYVRTDNPTVYAAPNPIGFYSGVSVAGNHVPPRPPTKFDSRPTMMTWAGFERAHEGSRVFFQLNGEAQYSVEHDGLTVKIRLRNTKVNVRNNMRALDLRYFKTPVRSVKVRRRGRDTTARIVLKHEAEPQIQLVDGKEGYKLLVIQFSDAVAPQDRVDPTTKQQEAPKVQPLSAASGN